MDSDDYLSPDMYAHLYRLLESGADVAECDYVEVTDDAAEFTKEFDVHLYTTKMQWRNISRTEFPPADME